MRLVENTSKEEINRIEVLIGEAFVSNELFHELGDINERHDFVMKYMKYYVDCTIESRALYENNAGTAFIGVQYSEDKKLFPQLKMLVRMLFGFPMSKIKRFMGHVNQIAKSNERYSKKPHIEILMVCVDKKHQGEGLAKELVDFAKNMAIEKNVPILFDTDMKSYSDMYQHMGCELYNTVTATNGVTRYSLIWKVN